MSASSLCCSTSCFLSHDLREAECSLPVASSGERGCTFCGGLGHRITDCPKLEAMQTKQVTNIGRKDYLAHSSMDF